MIATIAALILFALFAVACLVGFFVGLYFFVLSVRLERQRIASLGPVWAFWRAWSYTPSNLTVEGQRILPKWRKAMVVFFVCLAAAPLSASLGFMLAGKTKPLIGTHAPNTSVERTRHGMSRMAFISFWAMRATPRRAPHLQR